MNGSPFERPDTDGATVLQRGANNRWALVDDQGGYLEADAADFLEVRE